MSTIVSLLYLQLASIPWCIIISCSYSPFSRRFFLSQFCVPFYVYLILLFRFPFSSLILPFLFLGRLFGFPSWMEGMAWFSFKVISWHFFSFSVIVVDCSSVEFLTSLSPRRHPPPLLMMAGHIQRTHAYPHMIFATRRYHFCHRLTISYTSITWANEKNNHVWDDRTNRKRLCRDAGDRLIIYCKDFLWGREVYLCTMRDGGEV